MIRTFCDRCELEIPPSMAVHEFRSLGPHREAFWTHHLHWDCIVPFMLALGAPMPEAAPTDSTGAEAPP